MRLFNKIQDWIPRALLTNLQLRVLKLDRLIVLQETYLRLEKILFPWQLSLFQSQPSWFQYVSDFQLENVKRGTNLSQIFIWFPDHAYEEPLANTKMQCPRWPEKPSILGRSGTQHNAMVTKVLSLHYGAHLVEPYWKESNISDPHWLRCLFHHIWFQCTTSSLGNLPILKTWISLERREIFVYIIKWLR